MTATTCHPAVWPPLPPSEHCSLLPCQQPSLLCRLATTLFPSAKKIARVSNCQSFMADDLPSPVDECLVEPVKRASQACENCR